MQRNLMGNYPEEGSVEELCCQSTSKLFCAVKNGHRKCLHTLLESGVDVNSVDTDGRTALMCAVESGNTNICTVLIEAGADVNTIWKGTTALLIAAENGWDECLDLLLKSGAGVSVDINHEANALSCAARNGHHECVEMLLKAGVDVNDSRPRDITAVMEAAEQDQVKCVQSLIRGGACVNYTNIRGATPLAIAAFKGHDQSLNLLLEAGADVNLEGSSYCDDCESAVPLVHAAARGHDKCVNLLLKASSDVNSGIALMRAARGYHTGCMALILLAGADVNTMDERGDTALLCAASQNHAECVDFLLRHGATTQLDEALAVAVQFNFGKCIQSLVKAGANPDLYKNAVTPLIRASCSGDAETVAVLIKAGADINAGNAKSSFERSESYDEVGIETDDGNGSNDFTYINENSENDDKYGDDDKYLKYGEEEEKEEDDYDYDDDYDDDDDEEKEKLHYNYIDPPGEDEGDNLHKVEDYHTPAKAIFHAAANGHHECLDLLLKAGADVNDRYPIGGNTPLIIAALCLSDECEEVVKGKKKAEYVNYDTIQSISKYFDKFSSKKELCRHTPWIKTTNEDFLECVALLINAGSDINAQNSMGETALHVALNFKLSENVEFVRKILGAGADVNKKNTSGHGPLTLAARKGHYKSLNLLLEAAVSRDEITASFIDAVKRGKSESVDLLLKAGAYVNALSPTWETPLHLAMKSKHSILADTWDRDAFLDSTASSVDLETVKLLLLAGARVNRTDNRGDTALQMCLTNTEAIDGRKDGAMVLFSAGDSFNHSQVKTSELYNKRIKKMMVPRMNLKDICRHYIRDYLMSIDSHLNLFVRVKKLELPRSLVSYVLFHQDKVLRI